MMSNAVELSGEAKGLRNGIKDRAIWFHLLLEAAERQGVDLEKLTDEAIFRFGQEVYVERAKGIKTPGDFAAAMTWPAANQQVFQSEVISKGEDKAIAHFHVCPLVDAWKEYGLSPERISELCRLARKGDFGRISDIPGLELEFTQLIADGDPVCELTITRASERL